MDFKLKPAHETRISWLALFAGLPAVIALWVVLFLGQYPARLQWAVALVVTGVWITLSFAVREHVASPLRTLASLLEAVREGDYSIRARVDNPEEPLGEVMSQINAMASTLRNQRLGALEATALLRKVMEEIDVAIFAFDPQQTLRLVNRAAEKLLGEPEERLSGLSAGALGLGEFLTGPEQRIIQKAFPGASGRWGVARSHFREGGVPHYLLVVTDLTRPLREEELQAWQRLVRVIGHELNNSLTPIKSIAQSLESLVQSNPLPHDLQEDVARGLRVIATRSESLSRFMSAYAQLAKLPPPKLRSVALQPLLERVVQLETRLHVDVEPGPELTLPADESQLEQALINLIRNAVDAAMEANGRVFVRTAASGDLVQVIVRDEGPGIANTANLFVPFFTTKRGGSGIGLVLSRQIAEAHEGGLVLRNAEEGPGCEAILTLPVFATGPVAPVQAG